MLKSLEKVMQEGGSDVDDGTFDKVMSDMLQSSAP